MWHKIMKSRWLVVVSLLIAIFSISYAVSQHFFYAKRSRQISRDSYKPDVIGKPLPELRLVDFSGNTLGDSELRHGKVILVILSSECDACFKEGQFLRTVVDKYSNLRFYGVLLFWSERSINGIEGKFPMKLYFDDNSVLQKTLEVKSVPLRIFMEDGIVKKVWTGTAGTLQGEESFVRYIEGLAIA
ncbi:MAG: hypothetical protein L0226_17275 [Acidobacteria bacterium]|nr:hypothetical protein [Acidobacteriota bacterium]